jgi:hypothetical protein
MRKLALALAAVSALALSVPAFVTGAAAEGARADVKVVKTVRHRGVVKKVVVKRDRAWHRHHGWRAHRHGSTRTVIVKRPNGTVVKKKIIHRG